MGIHESQSLLWERMVGQSLPFMTYLLRKLREAFPEQVPADASPGELFRAINKLREPPFIRTEADEVAYSLHVILRFEVETALLSGKIRVEDVPRVWNAKMQELLGVTPPDDAMGALQDVHWASGYWGYFPTCVK